MEKISKVELYWYDSEEESFKPVNSEGEDLKVFIPKIELYWHDKINNAYKPLITDGKMPVSDDIVNAVTQNVRDAIGDIPKSGTTSHKESGSLILSGKDSARWEQFSGLPKAVDNEGYIKVSSTDAGFTRIRYWSDTFGFHISETISTRALIFVENVKAIQSLEFNFSQDWGYSSGAVWSISGTSLVEGWNELHITQKLTPYGSSYVSGNEILTMQIGLTTIASQTAHVNFYGLTGNHQEKTKIIFTFDDAWASQYLMAFPILRQYGFRGNIAVAPKLMEETQPIFGDTMTLSQMQELYEYGWDMCNHTYTHTRLGELTTSEAVSEIVQCKDWLNSNGFTRASDVLIYPYGSYKEEQIEEFANVSRIARTFLQTGDQSDNITHKNPMRVKNIHMYNDMTAQDVITYIDQTVSAKGSLVLSNHLITGSDSTDSMFYSRAKFIEVVEYIYSLGDAVEVLTMSEWANIVAPKIS